MQLRDMPVRDVMTTDVVSFSPSENVRDAMVRLMDRGVDAGPVIDDNRVVVGMLSTGDLIVGEARVHFPTVVNFLGVNVTLPFSERELDEGVAKALGGLVEDVMTDRVLTVSEFSSVEDAATDMHDHNVSRLPVVDSAGRLIGIIARGDIVRAIVVGVGEDEALDAPNAGSSSGDPEA